MSRKIWNLYAPVYERAMRSDRKIYEFMYERIPERIRGLKVLEIATGPGLLAKHVALAAASLVATDYADGMIAEAKKGECPGNLRFEVADAMDLPYEDASFDAVIIANALHILPDPDKALCEIRRVLRPSGILIAPNFVGHAESTGSRIWSGILTLAGIRFEHEWTGEEYLAFLEAHGWKVTFSRLISARIALMYAECEDAGMNSSGT